MTEKPKIGRPPSKNPKRHRVAVRLTDNELEVLGIIASKCGMNRSDVLRRLLTMFAKRVITVGQTRELLK